VLHTNWRATPVPLFCNLLFDLPFFEEEIAIFKGEAKVVAIGE
jgi:hypothetical protein